MGITPIEMRPFHYGTEKSKIQMKVLGHSLVRSLIRLLRSFSCLIHSARFAALTRLLARSFRSLPSSWESEWLDGYFSWVFLYSGPKCILCSEQEWVQRRIKFSSTLTLVTNTRKPFWPYPHLRDPATSSHSSRPQKRASSSKACVMWRVNTILYNESIYNWQYCFFIDSLCLNFDA